MKVYIVQFYREDEPSVEEAMTLGVFRSRLGVVNAMRMFMNDIDFLQPLVDLEESTIFENDVTQIEWEGNEFIITPTTLQ